MVTIHTMRKIRDILLDYGDKQECEAIQKINVNISLNLGGKSGIYAILCCIIIANTHLGTIAKIVHL